jgi:cell division protein FtsZ
MAAAVPATAAALATEPRDLPEATTAQPETTPEAMVAETEEPKAEATGIDAPRSEQAEAEATGPDLLALGESDQVPAPKPYQPAPEPLHLGDKAPADGTLPETKPFIAPPPLVPQRSTEQLGRPNVWAEGEMKNSNRQPEQKKARGLAARLWRRTTDSEATSAGSDNRVNATMPSVAISRPTQPSAAAVGASSERTLIAPDSRPPAPVAPQSPPSAPVTPAERLTTAGDEDDLLEIPSFLRRQAN